MQPKPMVFRRVLLVLACLAFFALSAGAQQIPSQQSAVPPRITQPVDETNRITLKGNTHPLARPEFDLGPVPANLPLNRMLLVLSRGSEQEAALEALLDQQQDKSSPNYHNWLTPEQFGQQFGPADQDVQAVTSWLETHGFAVSRVSKGRVVIEFSGTASQLQEALHTEIHKYAVSGQEHWANASDPQIPAALAPVVAGVASLNGFPRHPMIHVDGTFSRSKATGEIKPVKPLLTIANGGCGVSGNCYGLGPFDFASIYNVAPLWTATTPIDGTGQTIAIVGETDINPQDVASFRTFFGMPAPTLNVIYDGPDPGILPGEETEADLDVEWSGAVAKGATIDFVVSQSTETTHGIDLSAEYIIDNNLAPVMSESYGECELGIGVSGNQFFNQLWQQAATQGITVFISAGDNGSAGCDDFDATTRPAPAEYGLQVSGYASTPYNVAVGGTDFNDALNTGLYWNSGNTPTTQQSAKSYIPEDAWNNTCTNGIFASLGYTTNAETNCNNSQLVNFVSTIGGSGGKSACTSSSGQQPATCSGGYSKPSWQTGTGVPSDGKRDIPDVSLFAAGAGSPAGAGYIVCEADATSGSSCDPTNPNTEFLLVGGTSAASPSFAGIMALVNQKTASHQGNANYVFYKIPAQAGTSCASAQNPASSCIFYDVPAGSTNAMPCAAGSDSACVVKTSADKFGVLSGYSTNAGYDLATGLGSVNVSNLVNQWSTFAGQFKGTNATLTLTPPATPTHGQPWTVAASVSPQAGSGIPTGTISLIADTGSGPSGQVALPQVFQLSNGSLPAGTTTTFLPGGTSYKVTAHYSGDGTFAGSDSNAVTVTVNPEASKTLLGIVTFSPTTGQVISSNATTFVYGSPYVLRADVTNASSAVCFNSSTQVLGYACPTGSVTITDNGAALGPGALALNSQANAEYQAIQLTGGAHTLAASYGGDASYTASSTTDAVTVTPALTITELDYNPQNPPILIGTPINIQALVQSNSSGIAPTGTFTFYDGTTPLPTTVSTSGVPGSSSGKATLYGNGQITLQPPSGSHALSVSYSGDSNYAASTSPQVTVDAIYPTTITVTPTPSSVLYGTGASVTVTATIDTNALASSASKPTGTVAFSLATGNGTIGPATTTVVQDSNGHWMIEATASVTPQLGVNVEANYAGDSNYAGANATTYITVTAPDFSISAAPSSLVVTAGQTGTFVLTVTPATNSASTVTLGCEMGVSPGIPGSTCTIAPSSVNLTNGAPVSAMVSLAITGPSNKLTAWAIPNRPRLTGPPDIRRGLWATSVLAGLASLLLLSFPRTRRHFRTGLGFGAICLIGFAIGCGGGSSDNISGGGGGQNNTVPTITTISTSSTKVPVASGLTFNAAVSPSTATGVVSFVSSSCEWGPGPISLVNGAAQSQFVGGFVGTCGFSVGYGGDATHRASQSGILDVVFTGNTQLFIGGATGPTGHSINVNVTVQ